MTDKRYRPEQVLRKLIKADVWLAQGETVMDVCQRLGIVERTYYSWRKDFGRVTPTHIRLLEALRKENDQLKDLVDELALENAILRDVAQEESRDFAAAIV